MLSYAQSGLRLRQVPLAPRFLGQGGAPFPPTPPPISLPSALAPTKAVADTVAGVAKGGMAVGLGIAVVSAGATWVGIHTGIKEKGFLSFTGWTVGVLAGLSGLVTLATVAGLGVLAGAAKSVANQA